MRRLGADVKRDVELDIEQSDEHTDDMQTITAHITKTSVQNPGTYDTRVEIVDEIGDRYTYVGSSTDVGDSESIDCWLSDGLCSMLEEPRWMAHHYFVSRIVDELMEVGECDETVVVDLG